jgi:hypothetical protein
MRINPSSGSKSLKGSKSSTSTRKKSSSSDDSSSRSRKSDNVRGKSDHVYVEAHTTKKGTFVPSHVRGAPDGDESNNKKPYSGLNRPRKSNK